MEKSMQLIENNENDDKTYTPHVSILNDIRGIKRELAKLYRDARTGRIKTIEATKLAYILNILANIMVNSDLEERLLELERIINERGHK